MQTSCHKMMKVLQIKKALLIDSERKIVQQFYGRGTVERRQK